MWYAGAREMIQRFKVLTALAGDPHPLAHTCFEQFQRDETPLTSAGTRIHVHTQTTHTHN